MDTKDTQDDNSSLLAYRITMLEKSTAKGFEKLENKLDMLTALSSNLANNSIRGDFSPTVIELTPAGL